MKNIYVGNLPFATTQDQLEELFAQYGEVQSARIIMDRETGRSRGFAFVQMASDSDADQAISTLNDSDFNGKSLRVNEARPREDRPRTGGGNRGGFGGSRGGYGNNDGGRRF
ncbi:MAG: RNA-binding protein [Candidatus Dependentiae bacterium]|jgi:RNA recognition motif-containing protein